MAEIALELLLVRLNSLMVEGKLLGGVGRDVNGIMNDLKTMRALLWNADSRCDTEERVRTILEEVRDEAYHIEDVLDEFLLCLVRPSKQGFFNFLLNKLHYIKHLKTRRGFTAWIQNTKARLKAILERIKKFPFNGIREVIIMANTIPNAPLYIEEVEIVGIEVSENIIMSWLTEGEFKLTTISVVGMGGLGKTTVVKKVYESHITRNHFDCCVWITVSNSPVISELLRTTIKEVLKATNEQAPEGMDAMNDNQLIEMLKHQLWKKRYVIIFDDIWDINVWEAITFAFPNCDCGSRIIFTTRIHEVAACSSSYVLGLEPLKEQEAWRLLCMNVFRSYHGNSRCPEELVELSQNILKICGGLPLAIVLIAGLLALENKTVSDWKNVHDNLSEMGKYYRLELLSRIFWLSYHNLPYYLKPCLMYLSMFPKDYFIKVKRLIRLWIAEGFIEDKPGGVTMEEVARDYINQLISRNMIQVAELSYSCNELKSCKIHDSVREIILIKAQEEGFCTTVSGSLEMVHFHNEARRISIYHNHGDENKFKHSYSIDFRYPSIRSVIVFQLLGFRTFQDKFCCDFKFLRVLDLEGADLVEFPAEVVEFIYLRYLSLKRTKITWLPKSVGKLINLETLNLRHTNVSELPVEILQLQRLRYLILCRRDVKYDNLFCEVYGVSLPTGIGKLTCLQDLRYIDLQQYQTATEFEELGKLAQLRRLGITNLSSKHGKDLCLSLQKMEYLQTLEITSSRTTKFLELESLMSPPQHLRRLYLKGRLMKLPVWIASLMNLTTLGLQYSRLSCEEENDPLKAFQHLPNLVFLQLIEAYNGDKLCCSEVGGYKNLKTLVICKMKGLKRMGFMEGSMPVLRELQIWFCPLLEVVPHGIEHLGDLQKLSLFQLNSELVERIRWKRKISPLPAHGGEIQAEAEGEAEGEDFWKIRRIPEVTNLFYNTEGTLVSENPHDF